MLKNQHHTPAAYGMAVRNNEARDQVTLLRQKIAETTESGGPGS